MHGRLCDDNVCSLDLDENLSEEALDEKNAEYLETFPRRPSAALVQLIHDRCGTQKELSLRSGISEATISRMCSDDNFRYDIRQITHRNQPAYAAAAVRRVYGTDGVRYGSDDAVFAVSVHHCLYVHG